MDVTFTSLTVLAGYPRYSRKEWNLWEHRSQRATDSTESVAAVSPSHGPVEDAPVHHLQDDDALGAVLEELCQLGLQHWLGLMLGNHLQVVPGSPAPPLQLHQAVGQLFKVNLEG